jgi:predicted TIM-barrel fold metal-dependent hydrolase
MNRSKHLVVFVAAVALVLPLHAQSPPLPIIDMHVHAPPTEPRSDGDLHRHHHPGISRDGARAAVGRHVHGTFKKPPCTDPIWSPTSARELMDLTFAVLKRRNIYGVTSGSRTNEWKEALPGRIIPSLGFDLGAPRALSPDAVRAELKSGRYRVFGEVTNQYSGFDMSDPAFDPYLAVAEELDIPIAIHLGPGPSGAQYLGYPKYRARPHSALTIEDALVRHPKLRVSLMHAGWPMLDDLLVVMYTYPQVYVDLGALGYALPRAAFHDYLRRIVEPGFGKRVMFGSDQVVWPEAIEVAIQSIEQATFLTPEQKRDILYNNAARFLRLSEAEIASHTGR